VAAVLLAAVAAGLRQPLLLCFLRLHWVLLSWLLGMLAARLRICPTRI
jgi:hypothetical protein